MMWDSSGRKSWASSDAVGEKERMRVSRASVQMSSHAVFSLSVADGRR